MLTNLGLGFSTRVRVRVKVKAECFTILNCTLNNSKGTISVSGTCRRNRNRNIVVFYWEAVVLQIEIEHCFLSDSTWSPIHPIFCKILG